MAQKGQPLRAVSAPPPPVGPLNPLVLMEAAIPAGTASLFRNSLRRGPRHCASCGHRTYRLVLLPPPLGATREQGAAAVQAEDRRAFSAAFSPLQLLLVEGSASVGTYAWHYAPGGEWDPRHALPRGADWCRTDSNR